MHPRQLCLWRLVVVLCRSHGSWSRNADMSCTSVYCFDYCNTASLVLRFIYLVHISFISPTTGWKNNQSIHLYNFSGVVAKGNEGNPPKFWAVGKLSENFLLPENFRPKMQNLGPKAPILGKFRDKLKICAPIISTVDIYTVLSQKTLTCTVSLYDNVEQV